MKSRITEIQLTINAQEGMELRNQILGLLGEKGSMPLYTDLKGTAISNLFRLLSDNFESTRVGINWPENS
jgi:hypothetical protein